MTQKQILELAIVLFKWAGALIDAAKDDDRERLDALLTQRMKTEVILEAGEALARDLAVRKRRRAGGS